jgi:NarL family two-component system response regulator LiaR
MEKISILLADDHMLFREGLRRLLDHEEDLECVAVAQDGEEAVALTKQHRPDVVLIDIAMPKVDGIEAARQIKSACPKTAVLILSAYKHDRYVYTCMQARVDGYLLKNMAPRELTNAIRLVHAGEAVFSFEATSGILNKLFDVKDKEKAGAGALRSRELEVLKLAAQGMINKDIASQLCISEHTVRTHFANIFRKLGAETRAEAVSLAFKKGLITVEDVA